MITTPQAPLGASLVIASSFFYASYGIWTKLMGNFFQGYTASGLRSLLVVAILLPIAVAFHKIEPINLRTNWKYLLGMFTASLFTWGPLYYAILHAGIGISLTIWYASIVLGSFFFGWIFGQEQITKEKVISATLGIIGLIWLFSPDLHSTAALALFGALISGLSAGANVVFSKQVRYNVTQSTLVLWTTSIAANFSMAWILQETWPLIGWHIEYVYLFVFALASILASWLLIKALKLIDAGTAGILGLLEIAFAVIFGVIFFQETLSFPVCIGIVFILISAAIPYFREYKTKPAA